MDRVENVDVLLAEAVKETKLLSKAEKVTLMKVIDLFTLDQKQQMLSDISGFEERSRNRAVKTEMKLSEMFSSYKTQIQNSTEVGDKDKQVLISRVNGLETTLNKVLFKKKE